jgi:hypothetical protein
MQSVPITTDVMLWVQISIRVRCTTLCDKVCQWLVTGRHFSLGPPVSSTDKTDCHDITEILLKVALNTIKQTNQWSMFLYIVINVMPSYKGPLQIINASTMLFKIRYTSHLYLYKEVTIGVTRKWMHKINGCSIQVT